MKTTLVLLVILLSLFLSCERNVPTDFKTFQVNKKVKDFPDKLDLSSPVKSAVSIYYLTINGKNSLWRELSSERIKPFFTDTTGTDTNVPENIRNSYLNTIIKETITYKDSVAGVISEIRDSVYSIRWLNLENGKWVNSGEDEGKSIETSHQFFEKHAEKNLQNLRKINAFYFIPRDTLSFINYLKENERDPKEFVLDKLNKYKMVMYGEIHRRKASWDFLEEVVKDKRFIDKIGVIFMELGSDKQKDIDNFLANNTVNNELLLSVFRDYMLVGWDDKGKFDFIKCIWQINKNLPSNKRVRILAVDTPRPIDSYKSKEAMRANGAKFDRNEYMADTILNYLATSNDKRNALFIVGTGHVQKATNSAGSILAKRFPSATYAIFQHSPQVDNTRPIDKRLRHGIFDYAFYKSEDKPTAFELKNSPFGKEPFDGLYYDGNGTYQDNYDGYLFLGSLDNEPNGEILLDLYSDNFVNELDRRYRLLGSNLKDEWDLTELSKKAVIEKVMSEHSKTRWGNIIKPLKKVITTQ
jgi:hypothetical protein